jgi:hypothetical protein
MGGISFLAMSPIGGPKRPRYSAFGRASRTREGW